jgi:hypothetical protein
MLCLLTSRADVDDDEDAPDTLHVAPAAAVDSMVVIVECARDVVVNDAGADVPDSIWTIARRAGLDSVYAISASLQYPPYIEGDFDGDGVTDAAVLVEHRRSGKLGVAIVQRGTQQVRVVGAGNGASDADELGGLADWQVFRKGTALDLNIGERPRLATTSDALWIRRADSTTAFDVWTGRGFVYDAPNK